MKQDDKLLLGFFLVMGFLLWFFFWAAGAFAGDLPDPALTPGVTRNLTLDQAASIIKAPTMRVLKPGDSLRIVRRAAGLGSEEALDVTLLEVGQLVTYLAPAWVLVRLPSGEEIEVHISALEVLGGSQYG